MVICGSNVRALSYPSQNASVFSVAAHEGTTHRRGHRPHSGQASGVAAVSDENDVDDVGRQRTMTASLTVAVRRCLRSTFEWQPEPRSHPPHTGRRRDPVMRVGGLIHAHPVVLGCQSRIRHLRCQVVDFRLRDIRAVQKTTHCSRQSRSQCPLALVGNLTDNGAGFVEDVSL